MSRRKKKKKVSKRDTFKTSYSSPALVTAALRNPGGAGPQKSKRDRLQWDDERDPRPYQGGAPGLGKRR